MTGTEIALLFIALFILTIMYSVLNYENDFKEDGFTAKGVFFAYLYFSDIEEQNNVYILSDPNLRDYLKENNIEYKIYKCKPSFNDGLLYKIHFHNREDLLTFRLIK